MAAVGTPDPKEAESPTNDGICLKLKNEHLMAAFRRRKPTFVKEYAVNVPQVYWKDIGGQESLKEKLQQAIEWPLKYPETFTRLGIVPPRGLLMYGPPGCSKTMIAKAVACECGVNFISLKGSDLISKYVGESERSVREVFAKARLASPSVVFLDEIDAVAARRGSQGGGDVSSRLLTQLLTEIDGLVELRGVFVLAATNRPDRIDDALLRPGRLETSVYVPLPDANAREEIFNILFKKTPVTQEVKRNLKELVKATEGYSGAEITGLCHDAAFQAIRENVECEEVTWTQFEYVLKDFTPMTPESLLDLYEEFQNKT